MKRCPYSEEQFFNGDEEYENHLRMHESGIRLVYDENGDGNIERVLACKICEKTFQSGRGFAQHQQKGKTVYNCQECQKKFCNQFDLSNICERIMSSLKMRSTFIWQIQYVQKRVSNLPKGIEMKLIATSM